MPEVTQQEAIALGRMLYAEVNSSSADVQNALEMIADGAALNLANSEGVTTLMCASAYGHAAIVAAMAQSGRDALLEAKDSHGWTAFITAAHRADAGTLRALLQAGADPTVKDQMGRDALYYARGSKDAEKIKVVEDALNATRFTQDATILRNPVSVKKPLQYKL